MLSFFFFVATVDNDAENGFLAIGEVPDVWMHAMEMIQKATSNARFVNSIYGGLLDAAGGYAIRDRLYVVTPRVAKQRVFCVQSAPVGEYGMMSGAFCVQYEPPNSCDESHLVLKDVFISPQGVTSVKRLLAEVKLFVQQFPKAVRVTIVPNAYLVSDCAFGSLIVSEFFTTAYAHGFKYEYGGRWKSYLRGISVNWVSNQAKMCEVTVLTAAASLHRAGIPTEIQQIVFSYLPCAAAALTHATTVQACTSGLKRGREKGDDL